MAKTAAVAIEYTLKIPAEAARLIEAAAEHLGYQELVNNEPNPITPIKFLIEGQFMQQVQNYGLERMTQIKAQEARESMAVEVNKIMESLKSANA